MKLLWLDVETTGLEPPRDQLLEVAMVVTEFQVGLDTRLSLVDAQVWITHFNRQDWCLPIHEKVQEMHTANGLWEECFRSNLFLSEMTKAMETFLRRHFPTEKPSPAGRNVHFDLSFLPEPLKNLFSYRRFDVTSFAPFMARVETNHLQHRAMPDLLRDIELVNQFIKRYGLVIA